MAQSRLYVVFAAVNLYLRIHRFDDVKQAGKRAELLGMSGRCLEICTDARRLPFADESLTAAYTRNGFNHISGYVDSLKEASRTLKTGGSLVVSERKSSMWHGRLENLGLNYEERLEVLRRLGWFTHGQEFIENINRAGFEILNIDDSSYFFFVDAIKRN